MVSDMDDLLLMTLATLDPKRGGGIGTNAKRDRGFPASRAGYRRMSPLVGMLKFAPDCFHGVE